MNKGLFISFEGIDGAGKSTHITELANAFKAQGRSVCLTREPGGTPLAETLRNIALHEEMDALTEALLMFAGRREHILQVIRPALARGEVVLCDRFTDATFAYQGGGRGFNLEVLRQLEVMVQAVNLNANLDTKGAAPKILQPDLTLWFALDPAIAAERLAKARTPDKFESQSVDFFTKVSNGYAARMAEYPERFVKIESDLPKETVWQNVLATIQARGYLSKEIPKDRTKP